MGATLRSARIAAHYGCDDRPKAAVWGPGKYPVYIIAMPDKLAGSEVLTPLT